MTAALDKLEQQVSDGTLTVEEAAAEYAESIDADSNYVQSVNNRDGMTASPHDQRVYHLARIDEGGGHSGL